MSIKTRTTALVLILIMVGAFAIHTAMAAPPDGTTNPSNGNADVPQILPVGPPIDWSAHPPIHIKKAATLSPTGLNPSQIAHAYGFDLLSCYGNKTCGSGQTIAIVDAYDDPNIEADLAAFSTKFGLPQCNSTTGCFTKAIPQGLPKSDQGWALEESLDVEWAHAIAPGAKIILVEAKSNLFSDLFGAIDYAASQTGVHQVSNSWGGSEFSTEISYDSHFQVPGVSYTASSGDSGTGLSYPAVSPYVVGVGGTTLNVDSSGNVISETAWSGSGGGVSAYESKPSYQNGFNQKTMRGVPDVSLDADPNTGFPVYDSFGYQGSSGWFQVGGTSAGAPQWAALLAIANSGGAALSSQSFGTEASLYNAAGTSYSLYYRDIISGSNGACGSICTAATGYDFVTGLGSPLSNNLVPYLAPTATSDFSISASPNSLTVQQGSSGSSTITITSLNGFNSAVTLSLSGNPTTVTASYSLNPVMPPAGGIATSTLTINVGSSTTPGTYILTVAGANGSITHTIPFTLIVPAPTISTLSVAVKTDKTSYKRNSFAYITVAVTNSSPVSGASVTLNVCAPNNGGCSTGTGTTGSNGQVAFQYKIAPHAPLGTYNATAQASAAGNTGYGLATFNVTT